MAGTTVLYMANKPPIEGLFGDEVTEKAKVKQDKYKKCIDNFTEGFGPLNEDNKANEELKENVEMFCYTAHIEDHEDIRALKKACAPYTAVINVW